METDAALQHHRSSEESQTSAAASPVPAPTQSQDSVRGCCISQRTEESSETPTTDEANKGGSEGGEATCSANENVDEDDLPTEQIFQNPVRDKPPPALLREIDEDGNEKVISDHSTSAGFIFQNSLMYELD